MTKSNDLDFGRRSIVAQKKLMYAHLEDLIKYNTYSKMDNDTVRQLIMDVASGAESYRSAGIKHGISYNTINSWKRSGWIYEAVELGKQIAQDALDRRFSGVINKALDNLDDSLSNGDSVLGKDGKIKRKPVSAKDNALIAAIAFDKRQLVRGEATTISEDKSSEDRLKDLAAQFKKFAMNGEKVIEGEIVDETDREQGTSANTEESHSLSGISGGMGQDIWQKHPERENSGEDE